MRKKSARPTDGLSKSGGKYFLPTPIPPHQAVLERREETSGSQLREWPANMRFDDATAVERRLFTRIVPRQHSLFSATGCSAAECALPLN
jgi:hypothetical protein